MFAKKKTHASNKKGVVVGVIIAAMALSFAAIYFTGTHQPKDLTLVTHDSFVMSKAQIADFEKKSGFILHLVKAGDAGALTNRLILTKNSPIADAVFGIDNTFAGVAMKNGIIDGAFTATDFGNVCVNYDKFWFASHHLAPPRTIAALTEPAYKNLTVLEDPRLSSTGLAFLAATVDIYGGNFATFWQALKANGVKIDSGWDSAYYTDFSGSSGKGNYPIVLSYNTSPADEVRADGNSQTAAILDSCFQQTEYVAVLKGAKNPVGAKALINYLLSPDFQKTFPTTMYMYPIDKNVALPSTWQSHTKLPSKTFGDKLNFATGRSRWLATWSAIFN
jgi:thiamine transport system substrate-binding protein